MDKIQYYKRRQFALGPDYLPLEGWNHYQITDQHRLTVHPELPLQAAKNGENSLLLLGYMIDPYAPEDLELAILNRILARASGIGGIPAELESMSGRYVLIAQFGEQLQLFHDATGLRQVYYCKDEKGRVWCASQPHTLADHLGLPWDEEVLDYKRMPVFESGRAEFWLVNDATPFTGVFNLLPNHHLDLRSGNARRYWPIAGCIPELTIDESLRQCTPILENSIGAASRRFNLKMGISAGIDSRKTLAATRRVRGCIEYFTHAPNESGLDCHDVKVPAKLLPKLGLQHHCLEWATMSPEFRTFYESSVFWAREKKGHNAHTVLTAFGPDAMVLNSNISEISQSIYWLPKSKIDGTGLAIINGLNHPFAVRQFQHWLDGAQQACREAKMDVLALFFLEQRMGRWAVAAFSEYDVAHETFNPYNNRRLQSLMLAVPERYRRDRRWDVSLRHIRSMWPETLCEPINPQDKIKAKLQQFVRRFVVHKVITPWLPAYQYMRYLKRKRRFMKQGGSQ
jgi:hypothetical protein